MDDFALFYGSVLAAVGSTAVLIGFSTISSFLVHTFGTRPAWANGESAGGAWQKLAAIHHEGEHAVNSVRTIGVGLIAQVAGFMLMAVGTFA